MTSAFMPLCNRAELVPGIAPGPRPEVWPALPRPVGPGPVPTGGSGSILGRVDPITAMRRRPGEGADRHPDRGRAGARGHPDGPGRAMAAAAHRPGADHRSAPGPAPLGPAVLAGDPRPGGRDLAGARLRGGLR